MRLRLAVLTTLCAAPMAVAQAPSAPPAASPAPAASPSAPASPAASAPAPAPELQKLGFLVGDWIHEETYAAGPMGPGGPGKARSKISWVLGNQHLYMIYANKMANGQLEGRAFFGWDPRKRQYRLDWFDNMGDVSHYTGDFDAAGALVLTGEAMVDGRPTREQFSVKPQPDGKVVFTSAIAGAGGAMQTIFESTASPETKK